MDKIVYKVVRTKLGVKIYESLGYKYLCEFLSYKTRKIEGYLMCK